MPDSDRRSLNALVDAMHGEGDDPIVRAADRQAARDAGIGLWSRQFPETVDLEEDEPTASDGRVFPAMEGDPNASGPVWVGFVKGEA